MEQSLPIVNHQNILTFLGSGFAFPSPVSSDHLLLKALEQSPAFLSSLNSVHSAVCRYHQFAAALDVTEAVVRGWVNQRYLPTVTLGKYSFINVARYKADLLAGTVPAAYL
jgi:hypothetical protein